MGTLTDAVDQKSSSSAAGRPKQSRSPSSRPNRRPMKRRRVPDGAVEFNRKMRGVAKDSILFVHSLLFALYAGLVLFHALGSVRLALLDFVQPQGICNISTIPHWFPHRSLHQHLHLIKLSVIRIAKKPCFFFVFLHQQLDHFLGHPLASPIFG